jgi:hypothetical protein
VTQCDDFRSDCSVEEVEQESDAELLRLSTLPDGLSQYSKVFLPFLSEWVARSFSIPKTSSRCMS